ncbi:unnamed protein product [Amoebophrya sp. A120]|nr:unnamed protein product [Amoebophrya sp. A120]|eukprot:GSA120T00003147001.1
MNSRPGVSAWDSLDDIEHKLETLDEHQLGHSTRRLVRIPQQSVWEQRRTKGMQLRVQMTQGARTMGVARLKDKSSASCVLENTQTADEILGNQIRKPRQPPIIAKVTNHCVELRAKTAELKKAIYKRKRQLDSQEYIEKYLQRHPGKPPPPEMYDKNIMPKVTKTSAMLAGLNFRDLAVPLATLKWAVPPERMDIPSREPYTRVSMKADSKFGNLLMMGVGQRFKYPATFTGSPIGPNLDPPDLLDHQAFKHYFIVPKRKQKAQLTSTGDNLGPGSYQLDSAFAKKELKDDFVMRLKDALMCRPVERRAGTMGRQPRFTNPNQYQGCPSGPNFDPPGLLDKKPYKKYRITGRPKNAKPLLTGTTEDVGPGKYELPPVFGVIYRPRSAKSSPNSPRSPPRTRPSSAH